MDAMSMTKLTDKNGNDITAQQAYDAAMSGPVYVVMDNMTEGNISIELFISLDLEAITRENENVISIAFVGFNAGGTTYRFYAGQKPNIIGGGPRQ